LLLTACAKSPAIVVGSKNFTESVILGELLAQKLEGAGCRVDRRLNLGGTLVCDTAIRSGSIDAYVEYSGTALTAILHRPLRHSRGEVTETVARAYAERGLHWGPNLGFNDTFAMIVRRGSDLRAISDLERVESTFQPGFGYEFAERPDGWAGLLRHYDLRFAKQPRTMELGLTYRALAAGEVDLIAGNSTDGLIDSLGLMVLEDDRRYFPPYDAAIVYRTNMERRCSAALDSLAGAIDDATMRRLNYEVDGRHRPVAQVVREFLAAGR
jgi:glycine betaine/choline ABC-type transport system substrate-binding protein